MLNLIWELRLSRLTTVLLLGFGFCVVIGIVVKVDTFLVDGFRFFVLDPRMLGRV